MNCFTNLTSERRTTRNADFQTLKANHAQELNEQRKESIQNMEAMKLKFTTEIDELKLTIDELKLAASNQKTQLESQITGIVFCLVARGFVS